MKLQDVAWAAGLLEGEGSFLIQSGTRLPAVQCAMTDLDVLERLTCIFGGKIYTLSKQKEHHKNAWAFRLSGAPAAEVMKIVRPYMSKRRTSQIDQVLAVWDIWQKEKHDKIKTKEDLCFAVFSYYNSMPVKNLRVASEKFNVSHIVVRNFLRHRSLMK